jgi:lysophospholipase L1-like esterase
MPRLLTFALSLAVFGPAVAADPPKDFFFRPRDRVLFLGDSITEQYQYSTDIELYLTTRFPGADFFFLNAGIGGDTANGGAGRFQGHVLDEKPTAVTINFGMNDGGYGKFDEGRNKQFVEKTAAMLKMAKAAGVRVALISPNAVDRRLKSNGAEYLETQKQFYAPLKGIAEQFGVPFADQYAITRAASERMENDDPKAATAKPYPDGFHTASPGGLLMAWAILTELGAPALVSDVTIDAKAGTVAAKQCAVEKVVATATEVSFTRADEALPLPVQKDWLPMLPYTNGLKDLNWYGLTVKGLTAGDYAVKIDGVEVGRYTAAQLADGVNLGTATAGPVWEQGSKVFRAINDKNKIVHGRFRGVVMPPVPDYLKDVAAERKPAELKKRMDQIAAAQAEVNRMVRPTPHRFEVVAAK